MNSEQYKPPLLPIAWVESMRTAPFPYDGIDVATGKPFFDFVDPVSKKRFHTNRYGSVFEEAEHYQSDSVWFYVPSRFDPKKTWRFVVYFHGHQTEILSHVEKIQLASQIEQSGQNAIAIAPQFAKNAADSSAGKFSVPLHFEDFLREAEGLLKQKLHLSSALQPKIDLLLIAYSGGFRPLAYVLDSVSINKKLVGVVLLDAFYEEFERYQTWLLDRHRKAFFVQIFSSSTESNVFQLAGFLKKRGLPFQTGLKFPLKMRAVYFSKTGLAHEEIPIGGVPFYPIASILAGIEP